MDTNLSCLPLETKANWDELRRKIDPKLQMYCVDSMLRHFEELGAVSAIIEEEYLDRDFTDLYSNFYAKIFKRHMKLCKRMSFFKKQTKNLFSEPDPSKIANDLQEIGNANDFLGFVVIRPVSHAPIGRVVITTPVSPQAMQSHVLVNATYEVHLLGATLRVSGAPSTQQDSRVGSCAQACLWMAARHFHTKHGGPWLSTAAITRAATAVGDALTSLSLPAGSEHLGPNNMIQAIRAMDREPIVYAADHISPQNFTWTTVRPQEVINRYVDSGIPVIIGLSPSAGQTVGHAVLAVGHTLKELPATTGLPSNPTRSEFCECFLVNDDQRGVNIRLPLQPGSSAAETQHNIQEHAQYMIISLPEKVYIPAEHAEILAWELIKKYAQDWDAHKASHGTALGSSEALGDQFVAHINAGRVLARTYLTHGWRYKARMLQNELSNDFKKILLFHELPRFVWVTEFGDFDSLNHLNLKKRRISAHSVIDATSSRYWEGRSLFHAPGLALRWHHDPDDPFADYKNPDAAIADDASYFPKLRGNGSFDIYR